jgi:hypothetical protein
MLRINKAKENQFKISRHTHIYNENKIFLIYFIVLKAKRAFK